MEESSLVINVPRRTAVLLAAATLAAIAACTRAPAATVAATPAAQPPPDSIVLERTRCFGTCPAYRLRIDRAGETLLEPRNFQGDTRRDTVPASVIDSLQALLTSSGFWTLPDTISHGSPLCPDYATDHPTSIVSVFGTPAKRVTYYTGCFLRTDHTTAPQLLALRRFAARMDTLTGAFRHIRPGVRR